MDDRMMVGGWLGKLGAVAGRVRAMAQQIEPVAVGYPDEGFHWMVAEITGGE